MKLRRWFTRIVLAGAALGVAGFLVASSGVVSIKASSGHWAITQWILEYSMRRSVATHSLGIKAPDLTSPGLILKGAGPYAINCSPCHGNPGTPHPRVAAQMTPHPPNLAETAPTWSDRELFTIIKHGVKFTGMPAWPAQGRDDEVWAVVAFVRALPHIDADAYQEIVYGGRQDEAVEGSAPLEELAPGPGRAPAAADTCVRCHGHDGNGRGQPEFPRLGGQRRDYLLASLDAYAEGTRHSGIMEPVAYGLDTASREALADYFSGLPPKRPEAGHDAEQVARGRELARRGDPQNRVASCVDCHGPAGHDVRPTYPRLDGQAADYLVRQLELFQNEQRGGSSRRHLMHHVAPRLTPEQIRDVAAYYASLDPLLERSE